MEKLLFTGALDVQDLIFIILIVLLFFCGKKIPELMQGLGKEEKDIKGEVKETEKGFKESDRIEDLSNKDVDKD